MASPRAVIRPLLWIVCIAITVAGLTNVYGDNSGVLDRAKRAGCEAGRCDLSRSDSTPFSQSYDFSTPKGAVQVVCTRSAIFFGEFSCVKK